MEDHSQFRLLSERRFLPFFVTQFAGAFNDNLFKNALLLLVTYTAGGLFGLSADVVVNLAAMLFILPFFLFSAIAGQVADRFEKSAVIRWIKFAEVVIMGVAAVGLWFGWYEMLFLLLFLTGVQSAFFGPVKYAILPQALKDSELVGGNALVEMGTFVAILVGTLMAGVMMKAPVPGPVIAVAVALLAVAGLIAALRIPKAEAAAPDLRIHFRPLRETWKLMAIARENHNVFLSILAISWFWFLGAAYLTQFPNFAKTHLMGDETVVTILLAIFTIGIAAGSIACERLSGHKIELGIVPIGSLGLSFFGIDLYFNMPEQPIPSDWWMIITDPHYRQVAIDLLAIGIFGGLFIVPLYAYVQREASPDTRARVIAALNIFNALFMVISALLAMLMLGVIGLSIPEFFLVLSIMNLIVAGFVYQQVPDFALRFVIWVLSHTVYRVSHHHLDRIPEEGPALLVCNHVSYMDALVIAGAVRRPVRFVMDHNIFSTPIMGSFFRLAKTIPIGPKSKVPEIYEAAFDRIDEELAAGHLVCIFPEGKLTKDGEVDTFKSGVDMILQRRPVTVVPMALRGLWGSFFSHYGGPAFSHLPKRFWSRIHLLADDPVAPEQAAAPLLEEKVKALRGDHR
ncbi:MULTISPECIES: MFS transporter [unclassified Marinobacter]|uniref:MFS transporter n=1 Tax=unclassified Marinobacter TaxID=83889 RepID=UPI001267F02C|nr:MULTISPECIES: MFS transporter [unclassified Marinobacter]QFS85385.1 Lysophospholipid transporter LplT [Marinobacter sp. THAF197a]QFT49179.1 Lysophospholipid transporter LplT [Marinobacter sp. THAF39]